MATSIVTIAPTDLITNSRADLNANFASLNANKIETSAIDTDTALTANSDTAIPSQKAVKAYVDSGGGAHITQSELSAVRATGTVYRNTSGHTMFVTATIGSSNGGQSQIHFVIGATSTPATVFSGANSSPGLTSLPFSITAVVPNNWYYQFVVDNRTDGTLQSWWEVLIPF